jgi:aconitate hydratase
VSQRIESTPEFVESVYRRMQTALDAVRRKVGRPLTLTDKVLFGHLARPGAAELVAGTNYLELSPDRVAMQDATAQMALLQFSSAGRAEAAVPTTVHCDHLIRAQVGSGRDLSVAMDENREVYEFLRSASHKFGIGFWKPGSGIIHQVVLEKYAFPGGMIIGTDSHTPNAGGLGMFASGVGGADAVDVMAGFPWEVLHPRTIGVHLTGRLSGWTAPKDVILALCGILTVKGGTNCVIEYFGPGADSISATGKATITNMGAELGATTSIFPFDERMDVYLRGTGRAALADLAARHRHLLAPDPEVLAAPEKFYQRIVRIDLSTLEPQIVGPHTPDLARPVSRLKRDVAEKGYPDAISVALVGSCTNSSYEDISRAADVARQASARGVRMAVPFLVSPGSEQIHRTIRRDGQMQALESIGATVLANACGPCIGQWKREEISKGQANTIVTSFNRNFPARNDGNGATLAFIASPEVVIAYGLAGSLSFDPTSDALAAADGKPFRLAPPGPAPEVPPRGFEADEGGYEAPPADRGGVKLAVDPGSQRLQLLEPFAGWDGKDLDRLPLLLKARGKCTTDHISPAGPWLRFRGHLDHISDNCFLGAVNGFSGEAGMGENPVTGEKAVPFPRLARFFKERGMRWVVVGDENYGEGSSREHAAMSPRFLGAAAIIARSFARIHESNLKKQGVLPLTFADPGDYEAVRATDRISILGLAALAPGQPVTARLHHDDGTEQAIGLNHTLNAEQIEWIHAGSALNILRRRRA